MGRNDTIARWLERVDRRTFLKAAGVLGVGAVAGAGAMRSALRVLGDDGATVSRSRVGMGTFVEIDAVAAFRGQADDAIGLAFAEMDRLIAILSRHDSASPLSQLNGSGRLDDPPRELVDVLLAALAVHRRTHSVFDPTVGPLVELLEASRTGRVPSEGEIRDCVALVGAGGIRFDDGGIRLERAGMRVTLDGIAKGFIVDRMSDVLTRSGVTDHLVNAGGDIRTRGERAPGRPWRIAVEDPEKRRHYPDVIRMRDGAVATSGSYENYYDAARTRHHIVDPETGLSPNRLVSATVRARSVVEADALSTAVFVLGGAKGVALADASAGIEVLALDRARVAYASSGWGA